MPSGLRQSQGSKHFEIYYEQPWGGVASDKDPVDIQPNQLVVQQGVLDVDNVLCYTALVESIASFGGFGTTLSLSLLFAVNGTLYGVASSGQLFQYDPVLNIWQAVISGHTVIPSDSPWTNPPTAVQVVNQHAYIANFGNHAIYDIDFSSGIPGHIYPQASDYTGGHVMGVLDDYLLQFNTNNITDGLQPNRVNWSGPGEFDTWDPSIDRTAGFNTLAAVDDQLTGFLSLANVGIIISQKALTQMSPTGVGIAPFSFAALWTSEVGQGCIYPRTVSQYGQFGFLVTDSGAYTVGTSGFSEIAAHARRAILNSFQQPNQLGTFTPPYSLIAGCVFLYAFNSAYVTPGYLFVAIKNQTAGTPATLVMWLYKFDTQAWQMFSYNVDTLINNEFPGFGLVNGTVLDIQAYTFNLPAQPDILGTVTTFINPLTVIVLNVSYTGPFGGIYTLCLSPSIFNKFNTNTATKFIPGNLNLTFRAEEIKIGYTRKPTMRRVVVKAYGSGILALSITDVSGVVTSLGNITLDGTNNARTYYSPKGIGTVECPQLSITSSNFKGVIVKVMMAGTYADGEID